MEISQVCTQARCSGLIPFWLLIPILQHSAVTVPAKWQPQHGEAQDVVIFVWTLLRATKRNPG